MALNALMQMDAERAVPILKTVLAKRDSGSTCLRRRAVFLLSQKRSPETASILLDAARGDPDLEVRLQAVQWLSQVRSEEAVSALDSILRSARDVELQEKAVFALSQMRSDRAAAALRGYAERADIPVAIRERTIFWLGQQRSADNAAFLRTLYGKLQNDELKERVLFSLSQMKEQGNDKWLLDLAGNDRERIEIRKRALFYAGQSGAPIADLTALYDRTRDREMKEQLIFVYSQRREAAAVDKMLDIAKRETDTELRKKAVFWLGQSRDPRAAQFLLELINQP
jgi:HEAT repeat protein